MALADLVVEEARKWIGYLEKKSNSQLESLTANAGYNNYTIFNKWYQDWFHESGFQPAAWCAIFVTDMIYKACGNKEVVKHFAYCPYGVNWFKQQGLWYTSNPKRGDVIFFKDSQGVACHTGIVSSASSTTVVTIEGNTSSASGVIANGGAVAVKSYSINYSRILGYGRPPYSKYETVKQEDDEVVEKKTFNIDGSNYTMSAIMKNGENYIRLRDLIQAGYTVDYDAQTKIASLLAPQTRVVNDADKESLEVSIDTVKERYGLEDQTMDYLYRYKYGDDLIEKLIDSE